ncbi:MAG: DUF1559 domain-containing protein [Thermoguttaceae bacterium]
MCQYRLSTLLLAFVVVSSSLALFGAAGGIIVAAYLLAGAVYIRAAKSRLRALYYVLFFVPCAVCLLGFFVAVPILARKSPGRRTECMNNLKQIGLALAEYEAANGRLPPAAVFDKQGKAMHSWRTLILPYLERPDLYQAYNFREPWDGTNNSTLGAEPLLVFRCPSDTSIGNRPMTSYLAVTGTGTVWDDQHATPTPPRVMVVEVVDSKINWMEPGDITLEEACRGVGNGSGSGISSGHTQVVNVLRSDGQVWCLPDGLPPVTLRGLFAGDEKAWKACEGFTPIPPPQKSEWANYAALAVFILSYAALLFHTRRKRLLQAEPAPPCPPAAPGERGDA